MYAIISSDSLTVVTAPQPNLTGGSHIRHGGLFESHFSSTPTYRNGGIQQFQASLIPSIISNFLRKEANSSSNFFVVARVAF